MLYPRSNEKMLTRLQQERDVVRCVLLFKPGLLGYNRHH